MKVFQVKGKLSELFLRRNTSVEEHCRANGIENEAALEEWAENEGFEKDVSLVPESPPEVLPEPIVKAATEELVHIVTPKKVTKRSKSDEEHSS